jgi:hypothetical protein
VDWSNVAQDSNMWQDVTNKILKLQILLNSVEYLNLSPTNSFSNRILLDAVSQSPQSLLWLTTVWKAKCFSYLQHSYRCHIRVYTDRTVHILYSASTGVRIRGTKPVRECSWPLTSINYPNSDCTFPYVVMTWWRNTEMPLHSISLPLRHYVVSYICICDKTR